MIAGEGIATGRDLGGIDMRQITPKLDGLLRINLRDAKQPPVRVLSSEQ